MCGPSQFVCTCLYDSARKLATFCGHTLMEPVEIGKLVLVCDMSQINAIVFSRV